MPTWMPLAGCAVLAVVVVAGIQGCSSVSAPQGEQPPSTAEGTTPGVADAQANGEGAPNRLAYRQPAAPPSGSAAATPDPTPTRDPDSPPYYHPLWLPSDAQDALVATLSSRMGDFQRADMVVKLVTYEQLVVHLGLDPADIARGYNRAAPVWVVTLPVPPGLTVNDVAIGGTPWEEDPASLPIPAPPATTDAVLAVFDAGSGLELDRFDLCDICNDGRPRHEPWTLAHALALPDDRTLTIALATPDPWNPTP